VLFLRRLAVVSLSLVAVMILGLSQGGPQGGLALASPPAGTTLNAGNMWLDGPGDLFLDGQGVDVISNDFSTTVSRGESYVTVDNVPIYVGEKWQCVELAQRLYTTRGWHKGSFPVKSAKEIFAAAPALNFEAHPNNGDYAPVPGDLVVHDGGTGDPDGHVAVVDHVFPSNGGDFRVAEQNITDSTNGQQSGTARYHVDSKGIISRDPSNPAGSLGTILGIVHAPLNLRVSMNSTFTTGPDGSTKDSFRRGEMIDFRYNVVSSYKVPVSAQFRVTAWGRQSKDTIFDNSFTAPIDAGNPHWTYVPFYTPTPIPADTKSTAYVLQVSVTVNGQTTRGEHDFYVTP